MLTLTLAPSPGPNLALALALGLGLALTTPHPTPPKREPKPALSCPYPSQAGAIMDLKVGSCKREREKPFGSPTPRLTLARCGE